jgi:hypothetical protein
MPTHAPTQKPTPGAPPFSAPIPSLHPSGIPDWDRLETDLRQALLVLLTQMIGNHLPRAGARDAREVADDPR